MGWHIRNAEGQIVGHKDTCPCGVPPHRGDEDGLCGKPAAEGSIFCSEHDAEVKLQNAADRQGWGIKSF